MSSIEELVNKLVRVTKILLVTESVSESDRLSRMLEPFLCSVTTACVDEAVRSVQQSAELDLVLVDNRLSCADETRLMAAITALCPSPPIVLMTGYGEDELPSDASAHGFVGLLNRPTCATDFDKLFMSLNLRVRRKPVNAEAVCADAGHAMV